MKDEPPRRVEIADPAIEDLKVLKTMGMDAGNWKQLRAHIERIARFHNVLDADCVCELRMCAGQQVYRSRLCNLRMVFEVDERTMTVWAFVLRDDETYHRVADRLFAVGVKKRR